MTAKLDSGTYTITSLSEVDLPIGVNDTKPTFQHVYADAPVNEWKIVRVGMDTYRLSIGGYHHIGVLHGKVIASIERHHGVEWEIEHQESQNAYTITVAKQRVVGWTVPDESSDQEIEIRPIQATFSIPPLFLESQLYLIKKCD